MSTTGKAGRPLGYPKTGGRAKGTPNRATQEISDRLAAMGCDPLIGLAEIALSKKTPLELKVRCFTELAQYIYPKRKPVDIPSGQRPAITVVTKVEAPNEEENAQAVDKT